MFDLVRSNIPVKKDEKASSLVTKMVNFAVRLEQSQPGAPRTTSTAITAAAVAAHATFATASAVAPSVSTPLPQERPPAAHKPSEGPPAKRGRCHRAVLVK